MSAKCGDWKVWHWAHTKGRHCDVWWEPETEWHRGWKSRFPKDWQEIATRDKTGELHIADIQTPSGLVLEFQHSPLNAAERHSREAFYEKLIWIVDGKRLEKDRSNFLDHIAKLKGNSTSAQAILFNPSIPRITKRWRQSKAPVILDFGGGDLWHIPTSAGFALRKAFNISQRDFVEAILADRELP